MAALGGTGIQNLARQNHDRAEYLKSELKKAGFAIYGYPGQGGYIMKKSFGTTGLTLNEPLLWEKGAKGRTGFSLPRPEVEAAPLDDELIGDGPDFPDLSELDVIRHFSRLSQWNFGVDTGMYPLGSCTMKYNPKTNGKDRPGFVADISQVIYENGCNLEDSTMTGVSDEFALILLFSGHTLHVEGLDQAGIVYKVSRYLADNNINIANLNSKVDGSPESGAALYTMEIQVEISQGAPLDNIEQGPAQIADELNVDIAFG